MICSVLFCSDHCPISLSWLHLDCSPIPTFAPCLQLNSSLKFSKNAIYQLQRNNWKRLDLENDLEHDPIISRIYCLLEYAVERHLCIPKDTLSVMFEEVLDSMKRIVYEYVGVKSSFNRSTQRNQDQTPWKDNECRILSREFRRKQRKNRVEQSSRSYAELCSARRKYRNVCRRKRREFERRFIETLFFDSDASVLWDTICSKKKLPYTGSVTIESFTSHLADIANGKFKCDDEYLSKCRQLNELRDSRTLSESVFNATVSHMESLNTDIWYFCKGKSPGSDGLTGEVLKLVFGNMSFVFEKFMLCFYLSGVTPRSWDCDIKVGIVKPGKSGSSPSELRPITLVNVLTKVYERFLLSMLSEFFTTSETQAGFKKRYNCIQRVFTLSTISQWSFESSHKKLFCVFIDFSSFFDTVQIDILINYLYNKEVPPSLCRAIRSMFKELKARARLGQKFGDSFEVKVGIRQGSVISPFLGTAYLQLISDELSKLDSSLKYRSIREDHIFYADDMVVYAHNMDTLQTKLNVIFDVCRRIGLNINTEKTFWTVFHAGRKPRGLKNLIIGDRVICYESSPKYLGVIINEKICFKQHIEYRINKADRALSVCINFRRRFSCLRFPLFETLYERLVVPSLLYGSEVYGWKMADQVDQAFYIHMKRYFLLPSNVSKPALYWALGIMPLQFLVWEKCYKFWIQLLLLPNSRLEKSAYYMSKELHANNKSTWFNDMLDVFNRIGFMGDFQNWKYKEANDNFPEFRIRCKEYLIQKMKNQLELPHSKYSFLLSVFAVFKKRLFLEYTTYPESRVFLKLLLSVHRFEIETGRHDGTDRRIRFCAFCMEHARFILGDEYHHILTCPQHDLARRSICDALSIDPSHLITVFNGSLFVNVNLYRRYSCLCKFFATLLHEVTK